MKTALMFSGQGSQSTEMGLELYNNYACCKDTFNKINEIIGYNLTDIFFKEDERINETKYTQPAVFAVSAAAYNLIKEKVNPDYLFGLSSGEYCAVYASGAFDLEETVKILEKRGQYMSEASKENKGVMSAIIGLDKQEIIQICKDARDYGYVQPCNYNMPNQTIIGGSEEGVQRVEQLLAARKKKTVRLNVSGAFHTKFMESAKSKLELALKNINIKCMNQPVISNLTARPIESESMIVDTLLNQLISPVLFEDSIRYLIDNEVDTFIELGPSNTLSSFVKKINKDVTVYNVSNKVTFENLINGLGGNYSVKR